MGKRNAAAAAAENNDFETPYKRQRLLQSPPSSAASPVDADDGKPEFVLTKELVEHTQLTDLMQNRWRIGKPIGKGSFGEIFLASNDCTRPVTNENAKYVAKIEPHSNGPLFVEIHCLLNTAKQSETEPLPPGMPEYIASGSHYFCSRRYRFLILPRFRCDLHSIIKNRRLAPKHLLILGTQILDVLEHLHDKGYAHSDIKAENLMIGECTYNKATATKAKASKAAVAASSTPRVEFAGSNPVRSCRMRMNSLSLNSAVDNTYQDMVKSHYLRPTKNINYSYDDSDLECEEAVARETENVDEMSDKDFEIKRRGRGRPKRQPQQQAVTNGGSIWSGAAAASSTSKIVTEDRIFLIDFGLASKFVDSAGNHHPFCMDQRRAHDGTLEFTSRDAHMGAHSRRSDLECLGYNLMYWALGSLPWKHERMLSQPEQVHRMKEIFMTDPREMLKLIYGQQVLKFLGEFLHYVNQLAYDERPDYNHCRRIFEREFARLGYNRTDMVLNVAEMKRYAEDARKSIASPDSRADKITNVRSIAKLGLMLPFKEGAANRSGANASKGSLSARISPKNLRSKSDKKKKSRKRFSWAEILSQDPDQIARQRAEKEFEREAENETPIRYQGRPTYAILEIEARLRSKDNNNESRSICDEADYIKGYTKPMMEVMRRRRASEAAAAAAAAAVAAAAMAVEAEPAPKKRRLHIDETQSAATFAAKTTRRKSANPVKLAKNKKTVTMMEDNFYIRPKRKMALPHLTPPASTEDESSCSSVASSTSTQVGKRKPPTSQQQQHQTYRSRRFVSSSRSSSRSSTKTDTNFTSSGFSDDASWDDDLESDDELDEDFSPIKTRHNRRVNGGGRKNGAKNIAKNISRNGSGRRRLNSAVRVSPRG